MIRYAIALDALPPSYACHCRDCQTWSGNAFALHAMFPEGLLTLDPGAHRFRIDGVETMPSEHLGCARCSTNSKPLLQNQQWRLPGDELGGLSVFKGR